MGVNFKTPSDNLSSEEMFNYQDITFVHTNLFHLVLGIREQCNIDIDGYGLSINIQRLQGKCSSVPALHALATFANLLSHYHRNEQGSLLPKESADADQIISRLDQYLDDRRYQELVGQNRKLGYGEKIKEKLQRSHDMTKRLSKNSLFSEVFNYGSRVITVATGIPLPNASMPKALMPEGFLPPIISCESALGLARKRWASSESLNSMSIGGVRHRNRQFRGPKRTEVNSTSIHVVHDMFDIVESFRTEEPHSATETGLQRALLDQFEKNFSDGIFCEQHQTKLVWDTIKISFQDSELSFSISGCCQRQLARAWARMVFRAELTDEEVDGWLQHISS